MSRGALSALALLAAATGSCYPEPVSLEIVFPTEESFLYTEVADVAVFDLAPDEGGVCPELIARVREEVGPRQPTSLRRVPACALPRGGVVFEDVGEGLRGFVVIARDGSASRRALLHGCRPVEVRAGQGEVALTLQPTRDYARFVAEAGELECANMDEKCRDGC